MEQCLRLGSLETDSETHFHVAELLGCILGRYTHEEGRIGQIHNEMEPRPQSVLQQALELGWPFRVVPIGVRI